MDYSIVQNLYQEWKHEKNPLMKNEKLKELKEKVSPYDFLKYSASVSDLVPFLRFREVYGIPELFQVIGEMQQNKENINKILKSAIVVKGKKDIEFINSFLENNRTIDTKQISYIFLGDDVFKYGNIENISTSFSTVIADDINVERLKELQKTSKNFIGIPVNIRIKHISELTSEEANQIEKTFEINSIQVLGEDKGYKQGEGRPMGVETYRRVREKVDSIINKLCIAKNSSDRTNELFLTIQIINELVHSCEYDSYAATIYASGKQVADASGLEGLLEGKTICAGNSFIMEEILNCINIPCNIVSGTGLEGNHAWNQIKIGNSFFNVDITFARNAILTGNASGDLFMSDQAFNASRKRVSFGKDEPIVEIGGHTPKSKCEKCEEYMRPSTILKLLQLSQKIKDADKQNSPLPDSFSRFVGSSFQKSRKAEKDNQDNQYEI